MNTHDYENAVAVLDDIHWVGFYDKDADLHCNPYLLIDEKEAVLFDPGSIPHFSIVFRKVLDLVNPSYISTICVNHQDPDVCGNLAVVEDLINRSDLKIVTHSSTTRLIKHYGISSQMYAVDKYDNKLVLSSGRVLEFIHIPYLHSPFAIATYDIKTRTLFSGDLFGAISKDWDLFKYNSSFASIDAWHECIAPNNQILKFHMERIEAIKIDRILPQHGSIIMGDDVAKTIDHLKNLPCGLDLQSK